MKKLLYIFVLLLLPVCGYSSIVVLSSHSGTGGTPSDPPVLLTDAYTNTDGDEITWMFNQNISLGANDIDGLAITVDGGADALSNPSVVANVLTTDVAVAIEYGEAVLATYVQEGGGPPSDGISSAVSDVELGAFAGRTVTNLVPDTGEDPAVESIYVTQSGAGLKNGSNLANAYSVAQFNDANKWTSLISSTDKLFGPGDHAYFSGTITSEIKPAGSGVSGAPIVLDGYEAGDCDPINSECSSSAELTSSADFKLTTQDYIIIQDFRLSDDSAISLNGSSTENDSSYVTIRRCEIHDSEGQGIDVDYGDHITVGGSYGDGNEIYDIGNDTGGGDVTGERTEGFTISYNHLYATKSNGDSGDRGIDGIVTHYCEGMLIEYNSIHSHNDKYGEKGENGIDLKRETKDVIIRFNKIYDHRGDSQITLQGGTSNCYIYGNRIYNGKSGILVYARNGDYDPIEDIHIWSNEIFGFGTQGFTTLSDGDTISDVYLYNNTFAFNGFDFEKLDGTTSYASSASVAIQTGSGETNIKNNIIYKSLPDETDYKQLYSGSTSTIGDFSNNVFYWPGNDSIIRYDGSYYTIANYNSTYGGDQIDTDPGLIDPDGTDNTYGTEDDNYRLDGTYSNNALDLSGTVGSLIIQGETYTMTWDTCLDPATDWSGQPSSTKILTMDQDDEGAGWENGAYCFTSAQVTQSGGSGALSVAEFNALSGDYSDATFYFSGTITSAVIPAVYGTSGHPVTLDGYEAGDYDAIAEGTGTVAKISLSQAVGQYGISLWESSQGALAGKDYITIQDFEIEECGAGIFAAEGSEHIIVRRNFIHDILNVGISMTTGYPVGSTGESYITIGGASGDGNVVKDAGTDSGSSDIDFNASNDIIISYNHLYATKSNGNSGDRGIDGIVLNHDTYNVLIEYNTIHDHLDNYGSDAKGEDGIDIKDDDHDGGDGCHDIIVRYNHIYNHTKQSNVQFQVGAYNCYAYGNYIHNSFWGGVLLYEGYGGKEDPVHDIHVFGNIIADENEAGFKSIGAAGGTSDRSYNIYLYNNTFSRNGDDPNDSIHTNIDADNCDEDNTYVDNNIIIESRPNEGAGKTMQAYFGDGPDGFVSLTKNRFYWPSETSQIRISSNTYTATAKGSGNTDGDPGLVSYTTNDFKINAAGSAVVDAGDDLNGGGNVATVTIQGVGYPVNYDQALGDGTDWSTVPPTIEIIDRDDETPWDQGAYEFEKP
jgi:hypothetical protein